MRQKARQTRRRKAGWHFPGPTGRVSKERSCRPKYPSCVTRARAACPTRKGQLRAYADKRGLHIDWTAPYHLHEDGARIVEYRDKDPGVNGIARLTYARHTLVAVSLSVAP
ncbi:hypothetical protein LK540_20670 [Massilia sp. IC2-278]|uniref:hypothetical protein n=1 Tax=Massilia sp. IC2-278 TaxID=2887200 RepID=UPI001E3B5135|nr:hypothetical protein [Massilia sp. IC2-278]MCC2962850.1 hypothetical protein [Massilia sp. IC2-278]